MPRRVNNDASRVESRTPVEKLKEAGGRGPAPLALSRAQDGRRREVRALAVPMQSLALPPSRGAATAGDVCLQEKTTPSSEIKHHADEELLHAREVSPPAGLHAGCRCRRRAAAAPVLLQRQLDALAGREGRLFDGCD